MEFRRRNQTCPRKADHRWARGLAAALGLAALGTAIDVRAQQADPAEVTIGERLFLETRFAELFARTASDVNAPLAAGDPVLDTTQTTGPALPGPFAGRSINCRACHLVDEQLDTPGGGVILHFDGEFPSLEALVIGTLTGRNYGWRAGEAARAVAHIARVIREDDGSGELAQEFGGAYAVVLAGTDSSLPDELRLPEDFRIDVDASDDDAIVASVAKLIAAYVVQLVFSQDEDGVFDGSPYDAFLERNGLSRAPAFPKLGSAAGSSLQRCCSATRSRCCRARSLRSRPPGCAISRTLRPTCTTAHSRRWRRRSGSTRRRPLQRAGVGSATPRQSSRASLSPRATSRSSPPSCER